MSDVEKIKEMFRRAVETFDAACLELLVREHDTPTPAFVRVVQNYSAELERINKELEDIEYRR